METGKFFFIIALVSAVAGIFSVVHYFQGVDAANAVLIESKSKLTQLKETLAVRQGEWAKIEAVATKAQEATTKEAPLVQELDELKAKYRRVEGDFKYMVSSIRSTVDKVRATAVGSEYPEVQLTTGKTLKLAKIKKMDAMNISFIHADGFTIVPYDQLPEEIRERFDMGGNGLAEQVAAAEQAIQTAKYAPVPGGRSDSRANADNFGVSGVQTVHGMTINCPMPLKMVATPPPPGYRQMVGWEAKNQLTGIEVNLAVSDALESTGLNLDGGVAGAVSSLESAGVSNVAKSQMNVTVSDLPGRKCSISGISKGQPIFFELLMIQKEQRMYMAMVIFSNKDPKAREAANAILASVKVE